MIVLDSSQSNKRVLLTFPKTHSNDPSRRHRRGRGGDIGCLRQRRRNERSSCGVRPAGSRFRVRRWRPRISRLRCRSSRAIGDHEHSPGFSPDHATLDVLLGRRGVRRRYDRQNRDSNRARHSHQRSNVRRVSGRVVDGLEIRSCGPRQETGEAGRYNASDDVDGSRRGTEGNAAALRAADATPTVLTRRPPGPVDD